MIVYRELFCQCLMVLSVTCAFCAYIEPTRNELIRYLLEEAEYDHNFPPSTENATDVSVQLYITDFNSESDKDREIEFILYLRINWTDPRLDFTRNNTTYDVIKFGDDIVDSLWMPDLYFLNERKSQLHGLFEKNQLAYIYKNGSVFYSGRFNIRLHCVMTFDKYPFDTQRCPIEIQSYAYSTDHVLLHWNGDHAVQIDPASDPIRPKIPSQGQSIETRNTYPITGEFSTLRTEIEIPRPDGSYNMMITVPSVILVITALTSFLLGDNITPRIGVPTGTLISLFVQWSGTYARLSLDSTSEYLDKWMCGHLAFLGIILLVNAWICHYKYQKDKDRKCIRWFERFAAKLQARLSKSANTQTNEETPILKTRHDPNYQSTRKTDDTNQPGPSSNGENQPVDDNVSSQTNNTLKEPTGMDQPGPSSNGQNQAVDDNVSSQTNTTLNEPTGMNQNFHEALGNLSSDERYKWAKKMIKEKELEQIYLEFVREKTENDFYNLLEENESSIFVRKSRNDCGECCKSCKSERCASLKDKIVQIYQESKREGGCIYNFTECIISSKECLAKTGRCFIDCISSCLECLAKKKCINGVSCIMILSAYIIFISVHKDKWSSS